MSGQELDIVYEDEKIIVCNKPAGILAQSNRSFDTDMVSSLMAYRKKKKEDTFIGVLNRLDRNVSGLMLFAKTKQETARLSALMQTNGIQKYYYAVICGELKHPKGEFADYLLKDTANNSSRVVAKENKNGKAAKLEYEEVNKIFCENLKSWITLVKIHLLTGRYHQIRVQFSSRGIALAGDMKYGADMCANQRILSECSKHPIEISLCASVLKVGDMQFQIAPSGGLFELFKPVMDTEN